MSLVDCTSCAGVYQRHNSSWTDIALLKLADRDVHLLSSSEKLIRVRKLNKNGLFWEPLCPFDPSVVCVAYDCFYPNSKIASPDDRVILLLMLYYVL